MQNLYNANVRKVIVMGLAPIGCTPHYLWQYGSENGECVDEINNVVIEFNYAMKYMVYELNHELQGAILTFCDAFEGSMDILTNRQRYGESFGQHVTCSLRQVQCLLTDSVSFQVLRQQQMLVVGWASMED